MLPSYLGNGRETASRSQERLGNQGAAPFQPPAQDLFTKWFPGLKLSKTSIPNPRLRVLCFPSAGNGEDMFTNEGSGARRTPSPLLDWCRAQGAEVLAVQYPGRSLRLKEQQYNCAQDLASAILQVVGSRLQDGVPYAIITHSMGSWIAYELLCTAREAGLPLPLHMFIACMPAPDISPDQQPWKREDTLTEEEFKEECRTWDINEIVFSPAMWGMYQPLLREDFRIFDGYEFGSAPREPLPVSLTCFWGTSDRRVSQELVQGWRRFTSRDFRCCPVEGNHLFPLSKEPKTLWLGAITTELADIMEAEAELEALL